MTERKNRDQIMAKVINEQILNMKKRFEMINVNISLKFSNQESNYHNKHQNLTIKLEINGLH